MIQESSGDESFADTGSTIPPTFVRIARHEHRNTHPIVLAARPRNRPLPIRAAVGGVLMGLANLVPGISGGTMLLAAGVYPEFVESIAMVTRFTRWIRPWLVLVGIVVPAIVAIGLLAGPVRDGVLNHRWVQPLHRTDARRAPRCGGCCGRSPVEPSRAR